MVTIIFMRVGPALQDMSGGDGSSMAPAVIPGPQQPWELLASHLWPSLREDSSSPQGGGFSPSLPTRIGLGGVRLCASRDLGSDSYPDLLVYQLEIEPTCPSKG